MIATYLSQFDCGLHKHIGRVQMGYASSPSTTTATSSSSSLFELHHSIMLYGASDGLWRERAEMDIKQSAFSSGATAKCNWCSSSHQAVQPTAALPPLKQSMQTSLLSC
ncbi:hypothetical protein OPV22_004302 [Ensete ventricosum]|uniref:Uncharacterized protein n=1 Tax=Ensete ventricosum TaxID=4639 RepID=A0AAV8S377_ENSVE|nr:hypothetical protein OPV22_004302 [Ensete ventricosum]